MRIISIPVAVLALAFVLHAGQGFAAYDVTGGDAVIGLPDDTSDGIRFLDPVDYTATVTVNKLIGLIAAAPPLSVSTATNYTGTLILQGNTIVNGDIGTAGFSLLAVDVGASGTASSFGGDVNAAALNITGTGVVVLNGDLNGALSYEDDGSVTVASGNTITGDVTNDAGINAQGTLTLAGNGVVSGQVGDTGALLKVVNAGADGTSSVFSSDVYAQTMHVTGTGSVVLAGDLNGAVSYEDDGVVTLASNNTITGDVANDTLMDGQGTLTLTGSGTVSGQVGAAGALLKQVNAGVNGSSSTFSGDVYAQSMQITGTGDVSLDGSLIGSLSYLDDGELFLGDGKTIGGSVTNDTLIDGRGTLTINGSGAFSTQIGVEGASLKAVNAGADGTTVIFFSDIYAQTMNITGTGNVTFSTDLNGALSYDGDGIVTLTHNKAITGDVTNDTLTDGQGTLTFDGSGTVSGQVGAVDASLKEINAGADGSNSIFGGFIYAQTMNIAGTGDVTLNGDLNGALSYDYDGVVTLANNVMIVGAVTNDTSMDAQGTLIFAGSGAVAGQVGSTGAALQAVNAGADGSVAWFFNDVYTQEMNITGTGDVTLNGDLNGALSYDADGAVTLADGKTITGLVTNDTLTDGQGTLTLSGSTTLALQVGDTDASLKAVNAGADGSGSTFSNDVYTQSMNITGTGDVALNGDLNGALSYEDDGIVTLADGKTITGAVANDALIDGQGTLVLAGGGMLAGQIGAAGASLKDVNVGADASASIFSDDVYAQSMNITGTGDVALNGNLNGALNYNGDGIVTLADNKMITGSVSNNTLADGGGTLTLAGTGMISGQVGGVDAALKAVNAGSDGSGSIFANDVYVQGMNITGTGDVALNGDLNGALSYLGDGTVILADNMAITGAVTNDTLTDAQGTLTLAGSSAMSMQIGTTGATFKDVNAGANGSSSTFAGDVYTQAMNITGTGAVALDGDLNGALSYDGDGVVTLADNKTINGVVSNDSGINFAGELNFTGTHTTAGTIGIAGGDALRLIAITQGTFTMAHDMGAALTSIDQDAAFVLSGDRTITGGNLSVGGTGSSSIDLGLNTLTLDNGGVNVASGTSINLMVSSASVYGRIVQAAADAVIDLGTTINVNITGYVPAGATLTVVDGSGGSGVAGSLTVIDNDTIVSFIVSAVAGPDLILIAYVDYDPARFGGSTASVAETLAIIEGQDVSLDMRTIFTELHQAPSFAAVSHAIMQMRPYEGTAIVEQTQALSTNGRRAVITHLAMARNNSVMGPVIDQRQAVINSALNEYEDPMAETERDPTLQADIWVQGVGGDSDHVARGGVEGYSALAKGIIFGIDMLKMDTLLFGVATGYGMADIDPDQFGIGPIDIKHYPLILYAELHGVTPWRIDALFSAARNNYRTTRTMRFGSINRTASGAFRGQEYDLYIEGAYDLPVSSFKLTPSVSMDYSYLALDGYTESGADALNLTVKSAQYAHLRSGVGLAASTLWTFDRVRIVPEIYGKVHHEWLAPSIKTTAAFNGTNTYFQTTPMEAARNTVETGMSWDFALPKEMSLRFNYDAEFSQGYTSNILSAQFKSKF